MNQPTKQPFNWPAVLVAILALFAFVLSYASLRELALANGVGPWLSYLWPLLLDFAMIVTSTAILRASQRGERVYYAWVLTISFSFLATLGNILDVTRLGIPPVVIAAGVKALAPVALVLAFELLMSMIRADVRRAGAVLSMAQMEAESRERREKLDNLESSWLAELAELETRRLGEIEAEATLKRAEVEALAVQQATLQAEIDKAGQRLSDITGQVEDKRRELNTTQDATLINVWGLISHVDATHLDNQTRQFFVALLTNAKVPQKDIAEWAKKSVKTIQRDIAESNGLVKR